MFKNVLCYNRLCVNMFLLCVIKMTLCVKKYHPLYTVYTRKYAHGLISKFLEINPWAYLANKIFSSEISPWTYAGKYIYFH
jgi:hypothetical protein